MHQLLRYLVLGVGVVWQGCMLFVLAKHALTMTGDGVVAGPAAETVLLAMLAVFQGLRSRVSLCDRGPKPCAVRNDGHSMATTAWP